MRKTPVSNYAYACARVRARKKKLISPGEYSRLASMDLASVARFIGETQYRHEIELLAPEKSGSDLIETATYLNLASTYSTVINFCQGEAEVVLSNYLNELDLLNLKTLIRGKYQEASKEEIRNDLIPGGVFSGDMADKWLDARDVPELIDLLKETHYHQPLSKALERDPDISSLAFMEDALDKAHYAHLLEAMVGRGTGTSLFRDFIKREIDMRNILTLLRLRMEERNQEIKWTAEDVFIPGGRELTLEKLAPLYAMNSPKQLFGALEKFSYYEAIEPHIEKALATNSISEVVKAVEAHHRKGTGQFAKRYPLSILPIIHYLMLKRNEVTTLRLIARGKAMGLEPDTIRGLIVT